MDEGIDYLKLGFKCGIEIHQQLDTHKLFCECPSLIREDTPDVRVERRMRVVPGEMGEFDPAALHEFLRNRVLVYEAYDDTTCLVELDEEPPHVVNREALKTVLEVSMLLSARPVDELQIMRKTVIDGSNTSGFQRTVLVAMDGFIETSKGRVGIPTICLEEDAARKISDDGGRVVYRLDRLGIPLVEIATTPGIKDAEHAKEVAEKIGSILRASRVKRGLGTIRQDLNISIKDGERIEVKGVQDLRLISKVVEGEVARQVMLLEVKEALLERGVSGKDFDVELIDVTPIFSGTQANVVKNTLEAGGVVLAVRLKGLGGMLKGKFGPQIAQYARASSNVKGLFHGDELPAYGVSVKEVESVKSRLSVSGNDAFALISGERTEVEKALKAVLARCKTALKGVPEETRRALEEGNTEYMRPLPGSSRMYPETDEPLVSLGERLLSEVKKSLPELREDKAKRYVELGLSAEQATQISKSSEAGLFEEFVSKYPKVKPSVIATTLISTPKEIKKRFNADYSRLNSGHLSQLFSLLSSGEITRDVLPELMAKACEKPDA
ncbi:MAG: Glu-tRNA(Gln) amidotransferase subunit GatE, partial [Candidatus Altiarchaeota archaeon]|nr:Glu-tRNA(Gln) amidotransferase subunit GatE [Candidatus Altiarchaeota archaeon]